jgi:hypothetical protein
MRPTAKRTTKRKLSEHDHQVALIKWAKLNERMEPRLKWLFAIPNGARVTPAQAGKLKAEGMKAGVADLFMPVAARSETLVEPHWPGLWVEMKLPGRPLRKEQEEFADFVVGQGYAHAVCYDWVAASSVIIDHLRRADPPTKLRPT